ncbi:MAG: hypothetical protein V2A58_12875, partial [Planctomycetota bacterium]
VTREQNRRVGRLEKAYWITACVVTAAILALTLVEILLARPEETFAEEIARIAGALPPIDAASPPTREEILASGPGSELSALGREAVDFLFEHVDASRGEEAAKWLRAFAFYAQKHLHTERIAQYLLRDDEEVGRAAAEVLSVALEEDDAKENARAIERRYDKAPSGVRTEILAALASLRAREAGAVVLEGLSDPEEGVRLAACEAAARLSFDDEGARIAQRLSELAVGDASARVRKSAERAAGEYSGSPTQDR